MNFLLDHRSFLADPIGIEGRFACTACYKLFSGGWKAMPCCRSQLVGNGNLCNTCQKLSNVVIHQCPGCFATIQGMSNPRCKTCLAFATPVVLAKVKTKTDGMQYPRLPLPALLPRVFSKRNYKKGRKDTHSPPTKDGQLPNAKDGDEELKKHQNHHQATMVNFAGATKTGFPRQLLQHTKLDFRRIRDEFSDRKSLLSL